MHATHSHSPAAPFLRNADPQDHAFILRLHQRVFTAPWESKLIAQTIANAAFTVQILSLPCRCDLGFSIYHARGQKCNLDSIAIRPGWQRRGYGKILLEDWIHHARLSACNELSLQVACNNAVAIKLYQRYHFYIRGVLKTYYEDGNDAFYMLRSLLPGKTPEPDPA